MHRVQHNKAASSYCASYKDLNERFSHINGRINSLLITKSPIRSLQPGTDEIVSLAPGLKCHYKVATKNQRTPLKFKVIFRSTSANLTLHLSHLVERPDKNFHEKAMTVKSRAVCLTYRKDGDKEKFFADDYVYVTIEAGRDCNFSLKAGFGDMCFYRASASGVIEHVTELHTERDNVNDSLSFLSTRSGMAKTRSCAKRNKKALILIKRHRRKVISQSQKNDYEERCKRFISSNRPQLKKILMEIAKKKLKHINRLKALVMIWAYLMRTAQIAKTLHAKFIHHKKKKAESEMRIFKAIRIYMFLRAHVVSDSLGFKNRLQQQISSYTRT
eukprot:TRINITY_DN12509_c0_g3_i1.p1 TRINITY_DN12509_c0_g3~~TRINITY_DN12509_c0_g3_i1.p1  ORF type:complete len:330 (+),score=29.37 TRINITY_DN12509_c0_g3_i1:398-1387(+)